MNDKRWIVGLFILVVLTGSAAPVTGQTADRMVRLKARYYMRLTQAEGELREKSSHHAETDWAIPFNQIALVCLDIWNMDIHQDMFERDARVTRDRIVPLVAAARASGLQTIHAPSRHIARRHPNWVNLESQSSVPSNAAEAWPPRDFVNRTGEFAHYDTPETPVRRYLGNLYRDKLDFSPLVRPEGEEPVVATGEELHRLCAQKGILFLLYAGFHTPGCIITRDYGITEMRDRGYTCILVRDCTNGMETHETFDEQISLKGTIAFLEHNRIYTILSTQVMDAVKGAGK